MPQEFNVLQCYKCETFQVHQVKKSTKWSCKLCGEKQSIKKVFGRGSGYDCRQHVQKLNLLRAEQGNRDTVENQCNFSTDAGQSRCSFQQYDDDDDSERIEKLPPVESGKWSKYVDITEERGDNSESNHQPDELEEMYTTDKSEFDGFQKQRRLARKRNWQKNFKRNDAWSDNNPSLSADNFRANHPFKGQQNDAMDTASDENICNRIKNRNKPNNHLTNKPFGEVSKPDFSSLTFIGQNARVRGDGYTSKDVNDTGINDSSKLTDVFEWKQSGIYQEETVKPKKSTNTTEAKNSKWGQFVEDDILSSSDESDDEQGRYLTVNPLEKFQESQSSQEEESDSSNCKKYFHRKTERSPKGFITNKFSAFKTEELFSHKLMNGVELSQDNVINNPNCVLNPINTNTNPTAFVIKKGSNSTNKQNVPLRNSADDTEIIMNSILKQPGTKNLFKVDDLNDEDLDFEI